MVVGYVRQSKKHHDGLSLEAQEANIRSWAERNGLPIAQIFRDTVSGGKLKNRPGIQDALTCIGKGDTLCVYDISRLSRRLYHVLDITENILPKKKAYFVSLSENFNTSTASGEMFFYNQASYAQYYRKNCSERIKTSLEFKRKRGEKLGGKVPFGYNVKDGKLIPNDDEQQVIARMHELKAKGFSSYKITDRLNAEGILSKSGKKWQEGTVFQILRRVA